MFLFIKGKAVTLAIIITIFLAINTSFSFAQEKAGEVLQQLEKKEIVPREVPETIIIKEKEAETQPIPSGPKILIKHINVTARNKNQEKRKPLLAQKIIRVITSKYENKELTLPEINRIAGEITASYRAQGYIIVYAYISEQEIKDGVLEIGVVEGKKGEISVTGNKSYSSKFIRKHLEKIEKDPSVKQDTLEKALLILNEYPSLDVRASLKAGREFGTTDITAQVKDSRPVSGSLSYDNFGATTTSRNRLSAEFNIGNLITSGDLLMLRGLTGLDRLNFNDVSYGRAEYLIPLAYNGTKMGLYYSNSVYKAGEDYAILDIYGRANVAGTYVTHPIIRTMDKALDIRAGFDYKDVYEYMLDNLWSKDNIRVFNLGITYNFIDGFYGRNIINLTGYQGIRNLLGGNNKNDPDTSRQNSDGAFSKLTADVMRIQKLPGYNYMILKASGQISDYNLLTAEQFIIGGVGSVRGFRDASQLGDSGYSLSAELYLSPLFPEKTVLNQKIGDIFKLVLFADHGGVFRNDLMPGESRYNYLTSLGAGIRVYAGKYISARLDYAVPNIDGTYKTENSETYAQIVFYF